MSNYVRDYNMEEKRQLLNRDERILGVPRRVFFFKFRRALTIVGLCMVIQASFLFLQLVSSLSIFSNRFLTMIKCSHGPDSNTLPPH
jgi:hypothetical protein